MFEMDKKAKLFTKRIAERFSRDEKNKNVNTKSLLYKSISNVSKESLKRKLQDNFNLYLKYLNKCVRKFHAKSQADEGTSVKLIQTWNECRQLPQLSKEENRQICVRLVLKDLEHTDNKIVQLVDQFEEQCGSPKKDALLSWMSTCKHLLMSTTHPGVITKLMLYYLLKIIPLSEDCLQSGKETKTIADALKEFLVLSHLRYKKTESSDDERPPRRGDILASLLSVFIDLRVGDESLSDKKLSREITSLTSYLLYNDWLLKLDVLVQVTSPVNSPSLLVFAQSCLEQFPDNFSDCAAYLKFMMCLAKFKDHIEEILLQCMKIRAPLGFIDWLTERSPETMAEIPDDVRFKGRQITYFLLNNLSEDLQSQLLDVLTDKESAAYVSAVNDPVDECSVGSEQSPPELFVMDKQGEKQKKKSRRKSKGNEKNMEMETEEAENVVVEAVQEEVEVVDLTSMLDAINASRQTSDLMGVDYVSNSSQDSPRTQTSLSNFKMPSSKVKRKEKNRTPDETIVLDTETSSDAEDHRSLLVPDLLSHLRFEREDQGIRSPLKGRKKFEVVDITSEEGEGGMEIVIDSDSIASVTTPKKKKKSRRSSEESVIMLDGPTSPKKVQLDPVMETNPEVDIMKRGSGDDPVQSDQEVLVNKSLQKSPNKTVGTVVTEIEPLSKSKSKSQRRSVSSTSESELGAGKLASVSSPAKFSFKATPRKTRSSVSETEHGIEESNEQAVKTNKNFPELTEKSKSPNKSAGKSKKSSPAKRFSQTQEEGETTKDELPCKAKLSVTEMGSLAKAARESVNTESETVESGKRRKRMSSKLDIDLYDLSISTPKKGKKASDIESPPRRKSRSSASETEEAIETKSRNRRNSLTESTSPSKLVKSDETPLTNKGETTPRKERFSSGGEASVFMSADKLIGKFSPSKTSAQDKEVCHPTLTQQRGRHSSVEEKDTVKSSKTTPGKSLKSTPSRGALKTPLSKASLKTPLGKTVTRKTLRESEASSQPENLEAPKTPQAKASLKTPSNASIGTPSRKTPAKTPQNKTPLKKTLHETETEETPSRINNLKTPQSKAAPKTPKSKVALKTPKGKTPKGKTAQSKQSSGSDEHPLVTQTPNKSDAKTTARSPSKDTKKLPSKDINSSPDTKNPTPRKDKNISPSADTMNVSPRKESLSGVDVGTKTPRRSTRTTDSPMVTRSGRKLSTTNKHLQAPARALSVPDSIQEEEVSNRATPRRQLMKSTPKRTPRKREV